MRDRSDGSDFDIFFVPSRRLMTRVAGPGDDRLGQRKEVAVGVARLLDPRLEVVVELLRDVAGELQVLLLVVADGHVRRPIGEDVGRHQVRIDVEPDGRVLAVLAGLLLELRHAVEPAEPRDAIEDPGELGVRGDLRSD